MKLTLRRKPHITVTGISEIIGWMQTNRRTDVLVRCGHCRRKVGDAKAFTSHMLTCDLGRR